MSVRPVAMTSPEAFQKRIERDNLFHFANVTSTYHLNVATFNAADRAQARLEAKEQKLRNARLFKFLGEKYGPFNVIPGLPLNEKTQEVTDDSSRTGIYIIGVAWDRVHGPVKPSAGEAGPSTDLTA